jgi:hypothetical protein
MKHSAFERTITVTYGFLVFLVILACLVVTAAALLTGEIPR